MRNRVKVVVGIIIIAALIAMGVIVVRGAAGFVRNAIVTSSEPDPMFAQPAEIVTRPPDMDALVTQPPHATLDDYVPDEESPVDKTAEELGREAKSKR